MPNYTLSWYLAELYPILIHCRNIPHLNTLPSLRSSRQPIKLEHEKLVSQSESAIASPEPADNQRIRSPESSRLFWKTLLGSRFFLARYSLSEYVGSSTPPPPPRLVCSHIYYLYYYLQLRYQKNLPLICSRIWKKLTLFGVSVCTARHFLVQ